MSLIKQVLENERARHDHEAEKAAVNRMLFEKMIEKKKRQNEKFALLFQFSVCLLLIVFLVLLFSFSTGIGDYRNITFAIVLFSVLLLAQVCQKFMGFLVRKG